MIFFKTEYNKVKITIEIPYTEYKKTIEKACSSQAGSM